MSRSAVRGHSFPGSTTTTTTTTRPPPRQVRIKHEQQQQRPWPGKRRGRPARMPSPSPGAVYGGLRPEFAAFLCEWAGCRAELLANGRDLQGLVDGLAAKGTAVKMEGWPRKEDGVVNIGKMA